MYIFDQHPVAKVDYVNKLLIKITPLVSVNSVKTNPKPSIELPLMIPITL